MSFFEAEKTELQTQCTELQADLDTQENEKNKMINKFQNKLKALRQHSQHYNYKEPDEKIKKDFANLESKIRQFVDDCARPVLNATDQELERVWPKWTPELRNFLASPLLCNQVLEAYVWECLVARIFTPGSNFWGGDLGRHLEMALCMAAGNYTSVLSLSALKLIPCEQMRLHKQNSRATSLSISNICGQVRAVL